MRTLEDFAGAPQGARNMGAWAFGERFGHEAGLEEERPQLSRAIDRDRITRMARQSGRKRRVDQDEKKRPDESMIVARGNVWQVLIVAAHRSTPDHQR